MQYAIIENNIITNIAEADAPLADNWELLPEGAGIGWTRSAPGQPWRSPELESASPEYPRFVGNQKLDLFSPSEQLAVVTATMSDPVVKLIYDRMIGAAYMSYEDPETEQGLALLLDKGLITPERKAEIVAAMQPVVVVEGVHEQHT